MILDWKLKNFKSILDMETIDLTPLTIISGANSSGKSTLIQSILLLMQTLINRENIALMVNGELVSLGQAQDIWHNGETPQDESQLLTIQMTLRDIYDTQKRVFLKLEFMPARNPARVWFFRGLYAIGEGKNYKKYSDQITISLKEGGYSIDEISKSLREKFELELLSRGLTEIASLENASIQIEDFYPRALWVTARTASRELKMETVLADPFKIPLNDEELELTIPDEIWAILIKIVNKLNLPSIESSSGLGSLNKRQRINKTLRNYRLWFGRLPILDANNLRDQLALELPGIIESVAQWQPTGFFEIIERTVSEIFSRRIRYLSANRLAPTMLFTPDANANWSEVGVTATNVGPALREYSMKNIRFWSPYDFAIHEAPLINGLILWLQYFELLEKIEAEDRGKLGTLLKVYATGVNRELDLTSVGFGTSQVLPIILQGLLTPPNAVYIVEQPEVHLHPRVQSRLADFFLALTRVGIQCVIETHSEHIINRVRLRIAEDDSKDVLNRVRIYFAERTGSESHFRKVEPNEYGAILDWPDDFFDQAENDNLLIAKNASKKRRSTKKE